MQWPAVANISTLLFEGHEPDAACEHDKNIKKHEIFKRKFCTTVAKTLSALGGTLTRGSAPGPRWGLRLSTPGPL